MLVPNSGVSNKSGRKAVAPLDFSLSLWNIPWLVALNSASLLSHFLLGPRYIPVKSMTQV